MQSTERRSAPAPSLLPASVRLYLPAGTAAALDTVVSTLLDHAVDEATAALDDSLPRAEVRALAEDVERCAAGLERVGGYGDQMSLGRRDVPAVAAAARAARDLQALRRRLDAALEEPSG